REPQRADGGLLDAEGGRRRARRHRDQRGGPAVRIMDVSDVLRDRRQEPAGLAQMAGVSLAVHAAIGALLVLGPVRWLSTHAEAPKSVMTISLGGAGDGPKSGGLTAIGGRPDGLGRLGVGAQP